MPTKNLKRPTCYNLAFSLARRYASALLIGYICLYLAVSVTGRCSNVWMDRAAFRHGVF